MKTLDELKQEAIEKFCEGCTKHFSCERKDAEKFYAIDFTQDRPCKERRKIPEKKVIPSTKGNHEQV